MGVRERHAQWRAIARGEAQVIIGARSAVFAPARNLGMIVLDEEHESSFKQDNSPRYHARDVAIHRARLGSFPVVMGSATPSLETFHRARGGGEYRLLVLPERVAHRPLPDVQIVNMTSEHAGRKGRFVLSRGLEQLVNESLDRKEQVMLFLNRRGFTTHLFCPRCGFVLACPECSVSLIHHKRENAAMCHYCGRRQAVPEECPECHGSAVIQTGMGTERIEEEMRRLYPQAKVERVDGDTMTGPHAHNELYRRVRAGEIDILVGTQLIAKGHDFPDVTLVGVVGADTVLHFPDFRSRERTFQLLTQVAGRTGRGSRGGRVVIQTHSPDDPAIRFAAKHDYIGFAARELADRKTSGYPPFSRLVRILVEGEDAKKTAEKAGRIASALSTLAGEGFAQVLGPVSAPIPRIRGRSRYHLVIKLPPNAGTRAVLNALPERQSRREGLSVSIDVDPINML
jgi:primosomal protein N' (replication factor Y)